MSLLSGGSEFVQKDGTLFTVSLRTLAEASSTGGPHPQVTWCQRAQGAPSKEQEEPCLAGRAGLPRCVNSETREVWASTSPLCWTPWGGHSIKRVTQGLHSFGGKAERRSLPSALHQLGLIREAVTGVGGGISGNTLPPLRPWMRGGSSVLQGRRGAGLKRSVSGHTVEPNLCSPSFQALGPPTAKGRSSFSGATPH